MKAKNKRPTLRLPFMSQVELGALVPNFEGPFRKKKTPKGPDLRLIASQSPIPLTTANLQNLSIGA